MINSSKQVSINCKTKIHKTFATVLAVILSLTLSCITSTCFAASTNSTFTVTYNGNGSPTATVSGTVPIDSNFYTSDSLVTVLPPTWLALTIAGTATPKGTADNSYSFVSWNTRSSGLGTSYSPGDFISITGNITLYAQYKYPTVDEKVFTNNTLGGGILIATNNNAPAGQRQLLIMATKDCSNGSIVRWDWSSSSNSIDAVHGDMFVPSIGYGQNNIIAMANYINSGAYPTFSLATAAIATSLANDFPAAAAAAKCTDGGYNDWYLPSIGELTQIFEYINIFNISLNTKGNETIYWSSTEGTDVCGLTWARSFNNGGESDRPKDHPFSVRAVRAIDY